MAPSVFRYAKRRKPLDSDCCNGRAYSGYETYFGIRKYMKIGASAGRVSAISASNPRTIVVRGHDLCAELIGSITFTDHIWLLITGALPSAAQRKILDAALVAIAEHGLVPSVQVSRTTLAAAPEALQGAVAAGILGCGSVILGAAEAAGHFLAEIQQRVMAADVDAAISSVVREYRAAGRAIPGFGHPLHKGRDPRAAALLDIAREAGCTGGYSDLLPLIESVLGKIIDTPLAMNVSGAIAAVLMDAGFPQPALKGVPILARTASLIAHLLEEQQRPIGFALSNAAAAAIQYDGPLPPGFKPSDE
jgi:citrate synthase